MPKKDLNQLAKSIVGMATGEEEKPKAKSKGQQLGGIKGGKARARKLSAAERKEIAKKAAEKRWKKD